ncbi:MAG: hypothetical protein WDN49_02435 [Acetobacteraceae bacterium]
MGRARAGRRDLRGGRVRRADPQRGEWEALPQSAAVASVPTLEIIQIGDAPPQPAAGRDAGRSPASACWT